MDSPHSPAEYDDVKMPSSIKVGTEQPSKHMVSIDRDTSVPEDLFERMLEAGRRASETGSHRVVFEDSPWATEGSQASLMRSTRSSRSTRTCSSSESSRQRLVKNGSVPDGPLRGVWL